MENNVAGAAMKEPIIKSLRNGANQSGLRDYNERLLLSMLQRHGALPGSALAKLAGLSPQTVSVILRKLELGGLLERGEPTKGKVGKPSIPMRLAADGVLSIGLKIGRRSADLMVMDFQGEIRKQLHTTYAYPLPQNVFGFLKDGLAETLDSLSRVERDRLCGIGIAAPFELWNWHELVGAPAEEFLSWKDIDFKTEVAKLSDLPLYVINDATAACQAEHVFGRGKEFHDYAYFYIGAFIGGGVVLNHSVYEGHQKNAGALGSLRSVGPGGESQQLIDSASIYLLEARLQKAGIDPSGLWQKPQKWDAFTDHVQPWLDQTTLELAKASLSTCAVIDFEAVLIDGAFPTSIREKIVGRTRSHMATQDTRGLLLPRIEQGVVGRNARAIGAACRPVFAQFFLNTHAGFSVS